MLQWHIWVIRLMDMTCIARILNNPLEIKCWGYSICKKWFLFTFQFHFFAFCRFLAPSGLFPLFGSWYVHQKQNCPEQVASVIISTESGKESLYCNFYIKFFLIILLPLMEDDRSSSDITSQFIFCQHDNELALLFQYQWFNFPAVFGLSRRERLEIYDCTVTQWNDNDVPNQEIMQKYLDVVASNTLKQGMRQPH